MRRTHEHADQHGQSKAEQMDTIRMISAIAVVTALAISCGPETEDEPPGVLEYETPVALFYRLDRRVDIVGVDPMVDRSGCGYLTDRAYDDLMTTIDALDPSVDYGQAECFAEVQPESLLHLQGFVHSPFHCEWNCCNEDLIWAAVVYWAAGSSLYGPDPNLNGEPYVALEPDMPCPD